MDSDGGIGSVMNGSIYGMTRGFQEGGIADVLMPAEEEVIMESAFAEPGFAEAQETFTEFPVVEEFPVDLPEMGEAGSLFIEAREAVEAKLSGVELSPEQDMAADEAINRFVEANGEEALAALVAAVVQGTEELAGEEMLGAEPQNSLAEFDALREDEAMLLGAPPIPGMKGGGLAPSARWDKLRELLTDSAAMDSYMDSSSTMGAMDLSSIMDLMGFQGGGLIGGMIGGTGDGMTDSVPATIGGAEPIRVSEGETIIPADVTAALGNGSNDAGARRLMEMVDRIRMAKTGTTQQPAQMNAEELLIG